MTGYRLNLRIDAKDSPSRKLPLMQADVMQRRTRAAYRKAWKACIEAAIGDDVPDVPLQVAALRYTRASSVCPDWDGLIAGFKVVQDALCPSVLVNDRMENTVGFDGPMPEYRWEQVAPGAGYITIEIEGREW